MDERILIIEDETAIAELERDYLEASGYQVVIESSGEKGLRLALTEPFDLVVLDLMLPDLDGFTVTSRIREKKDLPVIIVSARKEEVDKVYGLGLGADDYMTKPFSPGEMVARVRAHLERYHRLTSGRKENELLQIRGLSIDLKNRRVWFEGEEKQLTAKGYDLLVFLATHPNQVFSREELLREIWNLDAVGENATVTVHINRLRDMLGDSKESSQYIETAWGVGYRFKV